MPRQHTNVVIKPALPALRRPYRVALSAGISALVVLFALLPTRVLFAETTTAQPPSPDYSVSELSALASLDELLPANLFGIEVVIFKRLDTSQSLLATADNLSQARVESRALADPRQNTFDNTGDRSKIGGKYLIDSREPLLLTSPRLLPPNLYALSAPKIENDGPALPTLADEPGCWPILAPESPKTNIVLTTEGFQSDADMPAKTSTNQTAETTAEGYPQLGSDLEVVPERALPPLQASAPLAGALQANDPESTRHLSPANPEANVDSSEPMVVETRPVPLSESSVIVTPYLTLIQELTTFALGIEDNQYRMRPQDALTLSAQAHRLEASGEFQVLEHVGWHQRVPARNAPQPIYIHLSDELQGYLSVTLGRYLHTAATLWLDPKGLSIRPPFGSNETASSDRERPYAELRQSRRMRSGELHYFDHPLFGVLVRIDKVTHPEQLTSEFEQFKSALALTTQP